MLCLGSSAILGRGRAMSYEWYVALEATVTFSKKEYLGCVVCGTW